MIKYDDFDKYVGTIVEVEGQLGYVTGGGGKPMCVRFSKPALIKQEKEMDLITKLLSFYIVGGSDRENLFFQCTNPIPYSKTIPAIAKRVGADGKPPFMAILDAFKAQHDGAHFVTSLTKGQGVIRQAEQLGHPGLVQASFDAHGTCNFTYGGYYDQCDEYPEIAYGVYDNPILTAIAIQNQLYYGSK